MNNIFETSALSFRFNMKYWSMRELVYGPLRYYNSTVDNLNMGGSDDSGS